MEVKLVDVNYHQISGINNKSTVTKSKKR